MVDPKRHINVLSPEEQAFLEECENEFAHRFTDLDEEFMTHCQREQKPPPVVHPWNNRRTGGGEGGGGRGGGNAGWRGERRFHDRRGGRPPFQGRNVRYRPYNDNNRRNDPHQSGREDNYPDNRNHSSSRPNYKSFDRFGDRQYNQEAKR